MPVAIRRKRVRPVIGEATTEGPSTEAPLLFTHIRRDIAGQVQLPVGARPTPTCLLRKSREHPSRPCRPLSRVIYGVTPSYISNFTPAVYEDDRVDTTIAPRAVNQDTSRPQIHALGLSALVNLADVSISEGPKGHTRSTEVSNVCLFECHKHRPDCFLYLLR